MSEFLTQRMRDRANEMATHHAPEETPQAVQELGYALTRKGMADMAKGSAAGIVGVVGDIFNSFQAPGAEVEAWPNPDVQTEVKARVADYNSNVDPKDQPFTTEWFGQRFGADTDRAAFQVGTFLDPRSAGKKTVLGMVGALAGRRAAMNMLGKPGATIRSALNEAEKLMAEGVDSADIWRRTNWIMDPSDGQWKFQIPVEQSKVDWEYLEKAFDQLEVSKVKLGDFLDNRLLFASYPQLKNIEVSWDIFNFKNPGTLGQADFANDQIRIFAINKDSFHDTLVHEIEHFIQAYENFPAGGTPATDIYRSLEQNINTGSIALAENRYKRLLYKNLIDLPLEVKQDKEQLMEALLNYISTMRKTPVKDIVLTEAEMRVMNHIARDAEVFPRTGRYHNAEREVINLGLQASILEQRLALFEDVARRGDELGLAEGEKAALLQGVFHSEYKRLAGEVNARLATYDLKMRQGTPAQQRWLRETNPIDRRRQMLREEGYKEEDMSILNVSDPQALHYADWYGGQLSQKAALQELQEAIKAKLAKSSEAQ